MTHFSFLVGDIKSNMRLSDDSTNLNDGEYTTHSNIDAKVNEPFH